MPGSKLHRIEKTNKIGAFIYNSINIVNLTIVRHKITSDSGVLLRELPPFGPHFKISRPSRVLILVSIILFCFFYGAAFALFVPFFMAPIVLPFAILSLLVIWTLPNSQDAPIHLLQPLLFMLFVSIIMWPNYLAVAIPTLPRITVVRIVGVPLSILFLILASTSRIIRQNLVSATARVPVLWRAIVLFAVIQTLSLLISSNKTASFNVYIATTITCTVVYFVACYVFLKSGKGEVFAGLICWMAIALSIIAFWEQHLNHLPWLGHVPSFLQVNDPTVERVLAGTARQGKGHRTQATFTTSLGLSEYLGLCMPFIFFFATEAKRKISRLAAIAAIPVVLLATVSTQARTGLLGIAICVLAYPTIWVFLEWRRNKTSLAIFSIVASSPIFLIGGLLAGYMIPGIRIRLLGGGGEQGSTEARIVQMHMGIPKILSHPWGYGIGQAAEVLGYTNAEGLLTIDSYPLRVGLEYGVIGFVVWLLIFGSALIYAIRGAIDGRNTRESRIFIPIAIAILSYILMKVNFAQEDNQPFIYALFGMLTALAYTQRMDAKQTVNAA